MDPFALEHRWIKLRLLGWALTALWQMLLVVDVFMPLGLQRQSLRLLGGVMALTGTVLIAFGYERAVAAAHRRAGEPHAYFK